MVGCAGGVGIAVYGGGCRRASVSCIISRTGRVSTAATAASPSELDPAHDCLCSPRGADRAALLRVKQLPLPTPAARARSARPLPLTTFDQTMLFRGRQGGPGSGVPGSKTTYRAVGKIAIP